MRITFLTFVFIILSSNLNYDHSLKMSFSKLIISPKGFVNIETRIFLDDITTHIESIYGLQQADFTNISTKGTQALQLYFQNHFYFLQREKKINLVVNNVSLSKNGQALIVNANSTKLLDSSKKVFLFNTLLCDNSTKQVNGIKYLGKHYLLNISNPKIEIQLE